ncbi:Protein kinase domain-containing protein [Mycena venus]|uniref:Protein kinase domain-containing protein n=1 Tax=Mycena venus TaxID=2733690 RepID=A0A8H7CDD3_9AGAR|nr:Protein kinase domain-containing protein [Mycena venus]
MTSYSDVPDPSVSLSMRRPPSSVAGTVAHFREIARIPDAPSAYVDFRYQLWFTWYILQMHVPQAARRGPLWWALISGAVANRDLFFWEDEDEDYIRTFINDHTGSLHLVPEMPTVDWKNAFVALEMRHLWPRHTASLLAYLTPQSRVAFMAWFIVTEVVRKEHFAKFGDMGRLHYLIEWWGISTNIANDVEERCQICEVSRFLGVWLETMLEVYTLEDLRLIPWHPECSCMESQLLTIVHAGRDSATRVHPEKDSSALSVLFDFIVSPWPLILWVVFRTMVHDPRDPPLEKFLAILRGPDQELFTWDHVDDATLYRALVKNSEPGLFPRDWHRYMVEVYFQSWLEITNITRTVDRSRRQPENLWNRLAAASLIFSSTLGVPQNILAPLDLSLDQFPFTSIAHVIDENYTPQSMRGNLESPNFWAAPNLRTWLSTRTQDHCSAIDIWLKPIPMSVVRGVQPMPLVLDPTVLPKNLAVYTYYLLLKHPSQYPDADSKFASLGAGQFLDTLQRYRLDVEALFRLLKGCKWSMEEFGREAVIWRQLCHPNLLPFFGVYYLDNRLCLVSPWMEHGNVVQFLRNAPPDTNRLSLILDVALGLKYLHAQNVVHGDLKAINILVTPSRRACIADFGLASIANAMSLRFTHSTAKPGGGTARYQAPELIQGESPSHFGSDVYAFACVCYEVGLPRHPFPSNI